MSEPFDADLFPDQVAWYASTATLPLSGGTPVSCHVEPWNAPTRDEQYQAPTGRQAWRINTPADPGVSVDGWAIWSGRTLRVTSSPARDSFFMLWQTTCIEVV